MTQPTPPEQLPPDPEATAPPPDSTQDTAAVALIAGLLAAAGSAGATYAAGEVARAGITNALKGLGLSALQAGKLIGLDAARPVAPIIPLSPQTRSVAKDGPTYRAQYLVNAARRVAKAAGQSAGTVVGKPATGATLSDAVAKERRYFTAHQSAQTARQQAAMRIDAAANAYGELVGWYAQIDERTTPECRAAHGRNFYPAHPPGIGLPGIKHAGNCRCRPGPPHAHAALVDPAASPHAKTPEPEPEPAVVAAAQEVQTPVQIELSANTARYSATPHPLGRPGGPGLWGHKGWQLPNYIQNVAKGIMEGGVPRSRAIAIAVGKIRDWAQGKGKVSPEVRAAAIKAIAEWEALRAATHVQLARITAAVELAATPDHRHIPGTSYNWRHGYHPLNVQTALLWKKHAAAKTLHAAGAPHAAPESSAFYKAHPNYPKTIAVGRKGGITPANQLHLLPAKRGHGKVALPTGASALAKKAHGAPDVLASQKDSMSVQAAALQKAVKTGKTQFVHKPGEHLVTSEKKPATLGKHLEFTPTGHVIVHSQGGNQKSKLAQANLKDNLGSHFAGPGAAPKKAAPAAPKVATPKVAAPKVREKPAGPPVPASYSLKAEHQALYEAPDIPPAKPGSVFAVQTGQAIGLQKAIKSGKVHYVGATNGEVSSTPLPGKHYLAQPDGSLKIDYGSGTIHTVPHVKAKNAANTGLKSVAAPKAAAPKVPAPGHVEKPAAPKAQPKLGPVHGPAPVTTAPAEPGTTKTDRFTPISTTGWTKTGAQKGSNSGGTYVDKKGVAHYVKQSKTPDHARNEALAAELYHLAGIKSADVRLVNHNGHMGTASPLIPDAKANLSSKLGDGAYLHKAQEGFATDAWLGNWDVVGLGHDNIVTDAAGNPVRVDPGGALLYRAQGAAKGDKFGTTVPEWNSLRTGTNAKANAVFGSMTDAQLKASAQKVAAISPAQIDASVDKAGFDPATAAKLKATLKARRIDVAAKAGITLPEHKGAAPAVAAPKAAVPATPTVAAPKAPRVAKAPEVPMAVAIPGKRSKKGALVVQAPAGKHQVGDKIQVKSPAGNTHTVEVTSVGKEFGVKGVPHQYHYVKKTGAPGPETPKAPAVGGMNEVRASAGVPLVNGSGQKPTAAHAQQLSTLATSTGKPVYMTESPSTGSGFKTSMTKPGKGAPHLVANSDGSVHAVDSAGTSKVVLQDKAKAAEVPGGTSTASAPVLTKPQKNAVDMLKQGHIAGHVYADGTWSHEPLAHKAGEVHAVVHKDGSVTSSDAAPATPASLSGKAKAAGVLSGHGEPPSEKQINSMSLISKDAKAPMYLVPDSSTKTGWTVSMTPSSGPHLVSHPGGAITTHTGETLIPAAGAPSVPATPSPSVPAAPKAKLKSPPVKAAKGMGPTAKALYNAPDINPGTGTSVTHQQSLTHAAALQKAVKTGKSHYLAPGGAPTTTAPPGQHLAFHPDATSRSVYGGGQSYTHKPSQTKATGLLGLKHVGAEPAPKKSGGVSAQQFLQAEGALHGHGNALAGVGLPSGAQKALDGTIAGEYLATHKPTLPGEHHIGGDYKKKANLAQAEKSAAYTYSGSWASDINKKLRTGKALAGDDKSQVAALDAAMAKYTTPQTLVLKRGMGGQHFPKENLAGQVYQDAGYGSTSFGSGFGGDVNWHIVVPKGSHGLSMAGIGGGLHPHEGEFLLPRGTQYMIEKDVTVNGKRYITATVVPALEHAPHKPSPTVAHHGVVAGAHTKMAPGAYSKDGQLFLHVHGRAAWLRKYGAGGSVGKAPALAGAG